MAKAELKTKLNNKSPQKFLAKVTPATKRADCLRIMKLMQQVTGAPPKMWGSSIIGFGTHVFKYPNGRELDWPLTGFSPRKQNITLYLMTGFSRCGALLARLGKHKTAKSCLYINSLAEIDLAVLKEMVDQSVRAVRQRSA